MSTTQTLTDKTPFASRSWHYYFRQMPSAFPEDQCKAAAECLLQRYSKITKDWNEEKNSEWLCRLFLGAKLVMAATLHVNALRYAESRNLRVVIPYLRYYAVFSLLRAVCYSLPEVEWKDGAIINIGHGAAIKAAITHLDKLDTKVAGNIKKEISRLKAERELISYRASSCGDEQSSGTNQFLRTCILLAEVAQFNSELFEASMNKHAGDGIFPLNYDYLKKLTSVEIDGHYFGDKEDAWQFDHLAQTKPRPANIMHLMTEGFADNFFGAWASPSEDTNMFNPDKLKSIIFDIPIT